MIGTDYCILLDVMWIMDNDINIGKGVSGRRGFVTDRLTGCWGSLLLRRVGTLHAWILNGLWRLGNMGQERISCAHGEA